MTQVMPSRSCSRGNRAGKSARATLQKELWTGEDARHYIGQGSWEGRGRRRHIEAGFAGKSARATRYCASRSRYQASRYWP